MGTHSVPLKNGINIRNFKFGAVSSALEFNVVVPFELERMKIQIFKFGANTGTGCLFFVILNVRVRGMDVFATILQISDVDGVGDFDQ